MAQTGYTPILIYASSTPGNTPSAANLTSNASGAELAINYADGKLFYKDSGGSVQILAVKMPSGILPIASGGTNATATPTAGAVAYGTGTAYAFTPAGTSNQVLISNGSSAPSWSNLSSLGVTSLSFGTTGLTPSTATQGAVTVAGTLVAANGGTGQSSYTSGDLLYASGSTSIGKLGIGTSGQILTSSGTAPQWSTLSGVAVTTFSAGTTGLTPSTATSGAVTLAGTLATTNGGTGLTSFTANGVVYASGTGTLTTGSALTFDGSVLTNTSGAIRASGPSVPSTGAGLELLYGASGAGISTLLSYDRGASAYKPIWLDGSYQAYFVSGSEQMRLTSTGLGIGTSSPSQKLEVNGAALVNGTSGFIRAAITGTPASGTAALQISINSTNARTIRMENTVSGGHTYDIINGAAGVAGNLGIYDDTAGAYRLTLDSSGNLGLGVSSPGYKLDVNGIIRGNSSVLGTSFLAANTNGISLVDDIAGGFLSYGYNSGRTNAASHVWYNGITSELMRLTSTGLGIGTSSPGAKLQVNSGDIRIVQTNNSANNGLYFRNSADSGTYAKVAYDAATGELQVGTTNTYSLLLQTNSTTRATIDSSGNLGLGVTPSAWIGSYRALNIGDSGLISSRTGTSINNIELGVNWLRNSGGSFVYKANGYGTNYQQFDGAHYWYTAPSGTAGDPISFTQAMTLDASGNLALGGTSAGSYRQAVFAGNNANISQFDTTAANGGYLALSASGTAKAYVGIGANVISGATLSDLALSATNAVLLGIGGTERARIDSSGNLGLGVTPSAWGTSGSKYSAFQFGISGFLAGRSGNEVMNLGSGAYADGSTWKYLLSGNYASMYQQASGVHTWFSAPSGTAGDPISFTQAMTLDSSGRLLVGTTTAEGANGITLRGDNCVQNTDTASPTLWSFRYSGTQVGSITRTTTATTYNTSSDYRLKDNQAPLTGSGAFIDALQPKTWTWKADGSKGVGFIAHEVQAVSPGSVVGEKDAVDEEGKPKYQAMEYGSAEFIANIIAELQSLRARVAALESKP